MSIVIKRGKSMDDIPCAHAAHQDDLFTLRERMAVCALKRDTLRQELDALRAERDYFRRIADGTYDWEYWRAPDGRHHYVSPSCERITGYRPGEFQADPGLLERIIHSDDYERFAHHLHTEHDLQQPYELEFRIVTRSGETRWIGHVCQPVYGSDGAWLGQRASNRDITAQKQAEETLLQSQQFVQRITAIAPYMIYVFDLARGYNTFVNTYGLNFFGCTLDEMQQRGQEVFVSRLHPDDIDQLAAFQVQWGAATDDQVFHKEYRLQHHTGDWHWIHSTEVVFQRDTAGVPTHILGTAIDITERKQAEEAHRNLVQFSLQGLCILQEGRVVFANPTMEMIHGYTMAELQAMSAEDILALVHPDDRAEVQRRIQLCLTEHIPTHRHENRIVGKDGKIRWVEVFGILVDFWGCPALQLAFIDITERKQMEEALRASQSHLQALFDNAAVGIIELTPDGRWLDVNQRALQMLGYTQHELSQRTYLDIIHPAERAHSLSAFSSTGRDRKQPARTERRYLRKDGTTFWGDLSLAAIRDEHGNVTSIMGILVNITRRKEAEAALKQANAQLTQQVIHDPLTGLYNRRYLDETLPRELQRATRHGSSVGIIMLDIDHFKRFNDTYGHDGGDVLLRAVGTFLQTNIRGEDIACRYGGEEFTLVLPGASLADTQQRAEAIRAGVQTLVVEHAGQALSSITVSLGVAVFSDYRTTADMLIRAADQALYQAKRSGRNQVVSDVRTFSKEIGRTNA
jgi:diguanylate cyclase (GGDEF)-like protein/PAS domain S-box-containing protein